MEQGTLADKAGWAESWKSSRLVLAHKRCQFLPYLHAPTFQTYHRGGVRESLIGTYNLMRIFLFSLCPFTSDTHWNTRYVSA